MVAGAGEAHRLEEGMTETSRIRPPDKTSGDESPRSRGSPLDMAIEELEALRDQIKPIGKWNMDRETKRIILAPR